MQYACRNCGNEGHLDSEYGVICNTCEETEVDCSCDPVGTYPAVSAKLDSMEFYDLCQAYRNAPYTNQPEVVETFENLKKYIMKNFIVRA
jgi:hypothetical protein